MTEVLVHKHKVLPENLANFKRMGDEKDTDREKNSKVGFARKRYWKGMRIQRKHVVRDLITL